MAISSELYDVITKVVESRVSHLEERIKEVRVEREEFEALRREVTRLSENVNLLAEAHKKSEERLRRLEEAVQKLEKAVEKLAQAQKKTEERLTRLEGVVEELAKAQKNTEERLTRVEKAVEELAEAQKKTERAVRDLAISVGRLTDTIGFGLEDIARVVVPGYLERHEGIYVEELERNILIHDGREIEVDLWAEGQREGRPLVVIGEVKSRIYEGEVKSFISKVVEPIKSIIKNKEIYPLMFSYFIHPSAQSMAKENGILLIASYQR